MPGVARMAITGRVGHVGERPAHLAIDRVGRQERLGVHRVHVVDAVQQRRLVAVGAQGTSDDVEDDRATEAAHVDRPRGVFESLTTCGPLTLDASSSAQSMRPPRTLGDPDDLVGEVAGRHLDDDLLALLLAQQRRFG